MNRKDWMLLVLAKSARALSPVQLQKSLFLLSKHPRMSAGFYDFQPYDYGPFCRDVYEDAEQLEREGLVVISPAVGRGTYREYGATSLGHERAEKLRSNSDSSVAHYLDRIVEWVLPLSFDELLRAIYRAYPETKARSVFQE